MAGTSGVAPRSAVRAYAAEVAGCAGDKVTDVVRFEDGNRHAVFKVSYLDDAATTAHLVVRVSLGGDEAERTQAAHEARVLRKVGGRAGPGLRDFRVTSRWFATPVMCMEFVPGQQRDLRWAGPVELQGLGAVVGWLHEQSVADMADPDRVGDLVSYARSRVESILSRMTWARSPLPAAVGDRLRDAAGSVAGSPDAWSGPAGFSADEGLRLLHGDIAPGNVLWGPDPVLIDWEYSRLGDPADEIAYLFDQNGLGPPGREAFWAGYREARPGLRVDHTTDRVSWWEPVTLLGSALWWAERWVRREEADGAGTTDPEVPRETGYYAERVLERLERLDRVLAGRR